MVHIYIIECCSAIKKNGILPFATEWIDLKGTMLSEVSQPEKDKYHVISLMFGILRTKLVNKIEKSHRYRKQPDGCQRRGRLGSWVKR